MAPKMKFAEGEKVLCFHGPLIYEAKCLKSSITKDKHVKYFIHYAGWNKNWDEWVPESRVLKYNDANVQKQKEVQQAHSAQPTKSKKASKSRKSEAVAEETRSSTPAGKDTELTPAKGGRNTGKESQDSGSEQPKKKRGRSDLTIGSEELQSSIKIIIPDELKQLLTDDWYFITKQQKLVSLPAKNTINQIFERYIQQTNLTSLENKTVIDGIKDHFNAIIKNQLLYDFEKLHHTNTISENPGLSLCDIYGIVHLLRLFTKLGGMLSYLDMEEKALQFTLNMIKDFLDYLVTNRSTLVTADDYVTSTQEYQKQACN